MVRKGIRLALVGMALLVLGAVMAACGGEQEVTRRVIDVPEHTIVAVDDTSFGLTRRLRYRIQLPERYSEAQARIIAESIVEEKHRRDDPVNALYFAFYFPGSDTSWADGLIAWAPNGDWSKASSVKTGDYDSFRFETESYGGE